MDGVSNSGVRSMADADDQTEDLEDGEDGDEPKAKKLPGKKIILFGVAPAVLIIGGVAAAFFLGLFGSDGEHAETAGEGEPGVPESAEGEEPPENAATTQTMFYDLPEMLVTLNNAGSKTNYLKIKVALEVEGDEAETTMERLMPRIMDGFQVYLRELRVEDLSGSAGMMRLKEELLARVNTAVYPVRVHDVLFKEMLVQ